MVVEGVGTLCSVESGVQTPLRARSPSPCTDKVEKGNLEALATAATHAFWGGGMGLAARPPLTTTWLLHGSTLPQHGRNKQNNELGFWLFCSKFLAEASKKIELDV
jgi:hypothetical protein